MDENSLINDFIDDPPEFHHTPIVNDTEPYIPPELEEKEPLKKKAKTSEEVQPKKEKDTRTSNSDYGTDEDDIIPGPNPDEKRYGVEKFIFAAGGPIKIINPAFLENSEAKDHWPHGRPVVWMEATKYAPDTDVFVCKGYSKHLVDQELVKRLHAYTNGMVHRWRQSSLAILHEVRETHCFDPNIPDKQYDFASKDVLKAMAGIAQHNTFPINILSKESVRALVKGVDTAEMAEFVLNMANCTCFSVIAFPKPLTNTFELQTRFNMNTKSSKAYGTRPYKMTDPEKIFNNAGKRKNSNIFH